MSGPKATQLQVHQTQKNVAGARVRIGLDAGTTCIWLAAKSPRVWALTGWEGTTGEYEAFVFSVFVAEGMMERLP